MYSLITKNINYYSSSLLRESNKKKEPETSLISAFEKIAADKELSVAEKEYRLHLIEAEWLEGKGGKLGDRLLDVWNKTLQGEGSSTAKPLIKQYDKIAAGHKAIKKLLQDEEKQFSTTASPKASNWVPGHEKILMMGSRSDSPLSRQLATDFQLEAVKLKEKIKKLKREKRAWSRQSKVHFQSAGREVELHRSTALAESGKELGEMRLRLFQVYLLRILDLLGEPKLPGTERKKLLDLFDKYYRFYAGKLYGKMRHQARCRTIPLSRYQQSRTIPPEEFRFRFKMVKDYGYSIFAKTSLDLKKRIEDFFDWSDRHPGKAPLIADEIGILIASLDDHALIKRFNSLFNVVLREKKEGAALSKSEYTTFFAFFNPAMDRVEEGDASYLRLADQARVYASLGMARSNDLIPKGCLIKDVGQYVFAYESNGGVVPERKTSEGKIARNLSALRSDQAEKQMLQALGVIVKSDSFLQNADSLIRTTLYQKVEKGKSSQSIGIKETASTVKYLSFLFRSQESWKARVGRAFVTGLAAFGTAATSSLAVASILIAGSTVPAIIMGIGSLLGFIATGYAFWKFGNRIIDSMINKHQLIDEHEKAIQNKKIASQYLKEVRKIGILPVALQSGPLSKEEVKEKNALLSSWQGELDLYIEKNMTGKYSAMGPMGIVKLFDLFLEEKGSEGSAGLPVFQAVVKTLMEGWLQKRIEEFEILPPHLPEELPVPIDQFVLGRMEKLGFREELMKDEIKDLLARLRKAGEM